MKSSKKQNGNFSKSLIATVIAASLGNMAYAEEADITDENTNSRTDEVITVTATKRAQKLEDIPISAVVKTGKMLENMGIDRVTDLQYSVPGFVMTGQDNSGWVQMTMRGISTPTVSSGFSLGTGMYIDGVDQGTPIAFNQELVGIEQVEVLRGPQGTIFGKNTIAGAFNITSTKPSQEFEGHVSIDAGNFNELNTEAAVAGGLTETMSARVSVFSRQHDGYVKNAFTGGTVNDQDQIGGKLQIRFEPSDDLLMDLSVDYMEEDRHFAYHEITAPIGGAPSDGNGGWDWFGTDPLSVNTINQIPDGVNTISHSFDDPEIRKLWGAQFQINYQLSESLSFTSITGFRHASDDIIEDTDHTSWDEAIYTSYKSFDQFSQEFRLASELATSEGEWDYLVGFYLSSMTQDELLTYTLGEDFGVMTGALQVPGSFAAATLTSSSDINTETMAIFGNANYFMTDDLSLNVGIRIGRENKDIGLQEHGIIASTPYFRKTYGETNTSPTVGLLYSLSENSNLYAKVTKGFKSGGFNSGIFKGGNTDIVFDSESVTSYEIGLKGVALNNTIRYSLAAYTMDYEDLQVEVYVAPLNPQLPGTRAIRNAADAEIQGVELEFSMRITDDLTVNLGAAYTDATFTSFIDDNGGNPVDYSGNQLPNSPKVTGNANVNYYFGSFDGVGDLSATLDYTFRDEWFSFQTNNESEINDSYGLINARVALELDNGVEISLYGKNLADKEYTTETWQLAALLQERKGFYSPRTYGVNFTYRFY